MTNVPCHENGSGTPFNRASNLMKSDNFNAINLVTTSGSTAVQHAVQQETPLRPLCRPLPKKWREPIGFNAHATHCCECECQLLSKATTMVELFQVPRARVYDITDVNPTDDGSYS
jgi:hypothetical protein